MWRTGLAVSAEKQALGFPSFTPLNLGELCVGEVVPQSGQTAAPYNNRWPPG
ncbi:hypothetical protein [Streptomyces dysideae]|uniref:hypothetical protein n=1 Tax=Streptomyces dysideae TaxID=909626 RepID=UPI001F1A8ADF|nr:hypothetical protein [Streptomyces dysideae]